MDPIRGPNTRHKDTAGRWKGKKEGASFRPIMETYWKWMKNVISMVIYVSYVCGAVDDPAGGSFASLPGKPGEALMWQRQSLWGAGLTLWCCGRDAEPVSTNPISITFPASYLWLCWPSALPPSLQIFFSYLFSFCLNVSLPSTISLSCTVSLFLSFCLSSPSFFLIEIQWQSFWCNIGSTPRKRDTRNKTAYKTKALRAILGWWKCTNCGWCKTCHSFDSCLGTGNVIKLKLSYIFFFRGQLHVHETSQNGISFFLLALAGWKDPGVFHFRHQSWESEVSLCCTWAGRELPRTTTRQCGTYKSTGKERVDGPPKCCA